MIENLTYFMLHFLATPWAHAATLLGLMVFGYTWVTKVDNVDSYAAAHVNTLQTEKADRDGQIPCTGVQQWKKGADVASAAALPLGNDGNYFDVTGTTGITSIVQTAVGGAAVQAGTVVRLHFDGVCLITHSANLFLPGSVNITTMADDEMEFTCFGTNQWRCTANPSRVGEWTPVYAGSGGSIGATAYSTRYGRYTRNGNLVTLFGAVALSNNGDWTGTAKITGLPFACVNIAGLTEITGSVAVENIAFSGYVQSIILPNNSVLYFTQSATGAVGASIPCANVTDTGTFYFTITYPIT